MTPDELRQAEAWSDLVDDVRDYMALFADRDPAIQKLKALVDEFRALEAAYKSGLKTRPSKS